MGGRDRPLESSVQVDGVPFTEPQTIAALCTLYDTIALGGRQLRNVTILTVLELLGRHGVDWAS